VRVEPWVNRALAFAKSMGLLTLVNGKSAQLTPEGLRLCDDLMGAPVLEEEKNFLATMKPLATERAIEKIMRMETLV